MKLLATDDAKAARRGGRWKRIIRRTFYVKLAVAFGLLVLAFAFYLRLVAGPVSLASYSERVATTLSARLGPGWEVALGDTALQLQGAKPAVRASGIEIRNPAGMLVVKAPSATVSLDPVALLSGSLSPREIEIRDIQLLARVATDGSMSFVAPTEAADAPAAGSPPAPATTSGPPAPDTASSVSRAVTSLLNPVFAPSTLIGGLDRATITGAQLRLVGADGRERAGFHRVSALFERAEEGARRVSIELEGPRGAWRVGGSFREDGGTRHADIHLGQVPLEDLLLLSGMSTLPVASDLKFSGALMASLAGGALARLEARFESSAGSVTLPGQKPVPAEVQEVAASWAEAEQKLNLPTLALRSGAAATRLAGALEPGQDGSWRLKLHGREAVLPGASERDPPLKVEEVTADASLTGEGLILDRLAVRGDRLDVVMTGSSVPTPDGAGMRGLIEARNTEVRRFLAIWPETVNPELRAYLGANLVAGTLEQMQLRTDLSATALKNAFSGQPIPDQALSLAFTVRDATLNVIEGLPPLRRLDVLGSATGASTTLAARQGQIEMPDGRRLTFSDGSYRQTDEHLATSVARIGFRLEGGADAVASFLRSPIIQEAGAFDIDPATVKGRADIRVALPLTVHRIPPIAELPIKVTGTLSDISADRVVGREKLEAANFTIGYDAGALSLRGEGRLGGSPATFDLRQPKTGPGEAIVNLTLDEAARTRRSLPSGPQVTGPIPIKITAPFGAAAKAPTRFEADLARASIDGLLPGWTKPAGRPGRIAFTLGDGEKTELRDFTVESGSVQMKGTAAFAGDGALERAELSTFKISPGDDLRAQVERAGSGYRLNLKGNVADARPVLKWVTESGSGKGQKGREPPDLDVELAANILTGHNDEAMTGVNARIGTRGKELRTFGLRGQFRAAGLEAQLVRDGGQPTMQVRSGDAGATLRFLDLYRRMVGGELAVNTTMGDPQSGTIAISSFAVRNEPALRSIATQNPEIGPSNGAAGAVTRLSSDQVDFTKLTAEFTRTASRVEYRDVVVYGAQVGFTLSGFVDYARDRLDILGTFVPAYGLNNAFSQVPVVGLLLGGGNKNEGLFAIDFKVSGAASAPTLTVNPLTAVAPGILRKLFGWMMPEEEATGTTPAPAPVAPQRRAAPRGTARPQ